MILAWLTDPTAWAGLLTLVLLELVLGIDNLVFVAILADKLPPEKRDRARITGLALALVMRLLLLVSVSWLMKLTTPLFHILDHGVSIRGLILIVGGLFLIYKATSELHEHISPGSSHATGKHVEYSTFGIVVAQIVVLDAIFSIDSVITAVGMVEHIPVMMIAVVIAVCVMMIASKPLTLFVSKHPTVILLCLSFLLMIGFSLICEGFEVHIPKGYVYSAIVFSVLIEMLQELRRRRVTQAVGRRGGRRARTTEAVMRLIGGPELSVHTVPAERHEVSAGSADVTERDLEAVPLFDASERRMVMGVLSLAEKPIETIMTLRQDIETLDRNDDHATQIATIEHSRHSRLVVVDGGNIDEPVGILDKRELLIPLMHQRSVDISNLIQQPLVLLENVSVIEALEHFRNSGQSIAFIVDEFGTLQGLTTIKDILQEIAGELPEPGESAKEIVVEVEPGIFDIDASEDIHDINQYLPLPLPVSKDYATLAGLVLDRLESLPYIGTVVDIEDWRLEVLGVERHRITTVRLILKDHTAER
ncbi:TerC family protein [Zymobacter sp. IVIA_5232.4 C2]|uniref:TerC family protein n=1 Tax=Zymobacter sp. IVIA_5232.4 C2 TaxID=3394855 RepID=UPI0039C073A6